MEQEKLAASLDFDGVLFPRIPAQLAIFRWALLPWTYNQPLKTGQPITPEQRANRDIRLPDKERGEFKRHLGRMVKPNMREFIESLRVDTIFGNTGRSNNASWTRMTEKHLRHGDVDNLFKKIYYKPAGVSSDRSKYWALRDMQEAGFKVTHYDDNAYTIRLLAPILPGVKFVIVEDLTSGLLFTRSTRANFPNVSSIKLKC